MCITRPPEESLMSIAREVFGCGSSNQTFENTNQQFITASSEGNARAGSKSSIRGLGPFPLHTDCAYSDPPPRYVLLRSVGGRPSCPTTILLFEKLEISEQLRQDLSSGLWICSNKRHSRICSVINPGFVIWDTDCMRPADKIAKRASQELDEKLGNATVVEHRWNDESSVLIIDNWRVLHGRGTARYSEGRVLERILL